MMRGYGNGGYGWGTWVAMGLMMLLFWGLLIAAVLAVVHYSRPGENNSPRPQSDEGHALRILDERFARGEIDAQEHAQRRDHLRAP